MRAMQWLAVLALLGCSEPYYSDAAKPPAIRATARDTSDAGRLSVVSDSGVSQVVIGRPITDVEAKCRVLADSLEQDAEALPQRVVYLTLGPDTIRVLVDRQTVSRLEIVSTRLRTADGVGVGSRVEELAGGTVLEGDGRLYVKAPRHCGLSFRLSHIPDPQELVTGVPQIAALPDTVRVDQILVTGCRPQT